MRVTAPVIALAVCALAVTCKSALANGRRAAGGDDIDEVNSDTMDAPVRLSGSAFPVINQAMDQAMDGFDGSAMERPEPSSTFEVGNVPDDSYTLRPPPPSTWHTHWRRLLMRQTNAPVVSAETPSSKEAPTAERDETVVDMPNTPPGSDVGMEDVQSPLRGTETARKSRDSSESVEQPLQSPKSPSSLPLPLRPAAEEALWELHDNIDSVDATFLQDEHNLRRKLQIFAYDGPLVDPAPSSSTRHVQWDYTDRGADRLASVRGFTYCPHLDGSYIDKHMPLDAKVVLRVLATVRHVQRRTTEIQRERNVSQRTSPRIRPALDRLRFPAGRFFPAANHVKEERIANSYTTPATNVARMGPKLFTELIDAVAKTIHAQLIADQVPTITRLREVVGKGAESKDAMHRFACFMAADGNNDWARLVLGPHKLLRYVGGANYFQDISFVETVSPTRVGIEATLLSDGMLQFYGRSRGIESATNDDVSTTSTSLYEDARHDTSVSTSSTRTSSVSTETSRTSTAASFSLDRRRRTAYYFGRANTIRRRFYGDLADMDPAAKSKVRIKPHRLAYVLMVHMSLKSVLGLIEALLDPYVIILIHVDAKAPQLKDDIRAHVKRLKATFPKLSGRLAVMRKSFNGQWGTSTLVAIQLEAYFELLQMNADWKYVVQLSGMDYPLRFNDAIYQHLETNHAGKSIVEYFVSDQVFDRHECAPQLPKVPKTKEMSTLKRCPFMSGTKSQLPTALDAIAKVIGKRDKPRRSTPFPDWHLYKQHQWMVLTRDFVDFLRTSPTALYFMAYSESVHIPDESFFAVVGLNVWEAVAAYDRIQSEGSYRQAIRANVANSTPSTIFLAKPRRMETSSRSRRNSRIRKQVRQLFQRIRWSPQGRWLVHVLWKIRFWRWRKDHALKYQRAPRVEPVHIGNPRGGLPQAFRQRLVDEMHRAALIVPATKHALHFEPGEWHPRYVTERDRFLLMEAVAVHGIAYTRKVDNDFNRAPVCKAIEEIRVLDWYHTFAEGGREMLAKQSLAMK